ncbi:uncharacterized protein LOC135384345 [Ornithodoros turicata]|uniref:uncharacterized protein LOC135384345 n=1 Tax=Ornithodoros turicata TaxID=34597 RepID=UPI00313952EC
MDPSEAWRLDALGISDPVPDPDDDFAAAYFTSHVRQCDGRYVVPLMVKPELGLPACANNRNTALQRLLSQLRRFRFDPELLSQYDKVIREYFDEGHAEKVMGITSRQENVYYMPHHAVVRQEAITTKLSVVYDASSHLPGQQSLNTLLMKGPKLNADLLHLLLQFRCSSTVLTADIRKAYLQIIIRPEDRDFLRFLWVKDVRQASNDSNLELVEWRMTRVPFGATSSPFLLAATLQHHFEVVCSDYPNTVSRIRTGFHVDDLVVGCTSGGDALQVYQETVEILKSAGMDIRKWTSNSPVLRERFLMDGTPYDNASDGDPIVKVLGLYWDRSTDGLLLNTTRAADFAVAHPATKRTVLKAFSLVYDPLGYIAPVIISARILFQDLWHNGLSWDQPVSESDNVIWEKWKVSLGELNLLRLPRCALPEDNSPVDVHCFADASPKAYGTAIHLRSLSPNGSLLVHLLIARARLAPLKQVSLPRLELLACLLATRLYRHVSAMKTLSQVPVHFWTDSTIALQWIHGSGSKTQQFVQSRITEILSSSRADQWFHCSGSDNPADLLTRGVSATTLKCCRLWWTGPGWLSSSFGTFVSTENQLCQPGTRLTDDRASPASECPAVLKHDFVLAVVAIEEWMEITDYGTSSRLLRVTAWMLRFANNVRSARPSVSGPLTLEEITHVENFWIRRVQAEAFPHEVAALSKGNVVKPSSSLHAFQLFLDANGIMRVGGRLHQLNVVDAIKHPILLPSKHHFTHLVILDVHRQALHAGVQDTITQVRNRFWVLRARQTVRRVLHSCLSCRRQRAELASVPTAPLPRERITQANPFSVVGLDFAGPLFITNAASGKAYIVLFSCGVTRAIHLELASSMNAVDFLLAFRRFVSRRGVPTLVYSDNARTFHTCAAILSAPTTAEVQDFATQHRIQWRFIVERAPWWGGWWERLIGTVKAALRRCLGRSRLTFEQLTTALCDVEALVNSRPLTHVASDVEELVPLTPSHFLIGKRAISLPGEHAAISQPDAEDLRHNFREMLKAKELFWKRWRYEYLLQLRSAHVTASPTQSRFKKGDVVVLQEDNVRPPFWKLGRIAKLIRGRDGLVRACSVRLASGTTVTRPVQRLCRLEADVSSPAAGDDVAD